MVDMSKTKLYGWKCPKCKSYGILRIIDAKQQKLLVKGFIKKHYYILHCNTMIELVNGRKG